MAKIVTDKTANDVRRQYGGPPQEAAKGTTRTGRTAQKQQKVEKNSPPLGKPVIDTPLFERKITRLFGKIKCYITIGVNKLRLSLHLYTDKDSRRQLKDGIQQAENKIISLNSNESSKAHWQAAKENLEDGQIGDAIGHAGKSATQWFRSLWHGALSQPNDDENE